MNNIAYKEYWTVMGGRLKRPRTMKLGSLIEYALARGMNGDDHGWVFATAEVVKYLRSKGYTVDYQRIEEGAQG